MEHIPPKEVTQCLILSVCLRIDQIFYKLIHEWAVKSIIKEFILGVPTHTTALEQQWKGNDTMKLVLTYITCFPLA